MGMLATVINSIGLSLSLKGLGVEAVVYSATPMEPFANYYVRDSALALLVRGGVAIIAGGTGNPFFTTDSASALRAVELSADILLKGTRVDGVYDSDPQLNPEAVKFEELKYLEVIQRGLGVMDTTATSLCMDNDIPIIVFGIDEPGNIVRAAMGHPIGTVVGGN